MSLDVKKKIIFVLSRSLVVFVVIYLVAALFINKEKTRVADKSKTSFYTHPDAFGPLVELFETKKPLTPQQFEEYKYYLEGYLKKNPKALDVMFILGYIYGQSGNQQKAHKLFEEIVFNSTDNIWARFNLGVIKLKDREYPAATEDFRKLITTTPEEAMAFFRNSKDIMDPLMHAAHMAPNDLRRRIKTLYQDSYLALLICYEHLKDYKAVADTARLALMANVGHKAEFYFYAGKASFMLEDYGAAESSLREAVKLRQDHLEAQQYLQWSLEKLGNKEQADRVADEVKNLESMNIAQDSLESQIGLRLY